jgi:cell division protein FtsW
MKNLNVSAHRPQFDLLLLIPFLLLIMFGWVMISSASFDYASNNYGDPFFYFKRHGFYLIISILAVILSCNIPINLWEKSGPYLLIFSLFLLILILLPGVGYTANHATRWLSFGVFTFQVSEFAKLGLIIYLGNYLVRQHDIVTNKFRGFFNIILMLGMLVTLLLSQPDFGAAVVITATALVMLFLGGVIFWQFNVVIFILSLIFIGFIFLEDYRVERLYAYLDPWSDQFGQGYQLTQSLIAFGRGEWLGLGLGNSIQKLFYLPEAHTDFIFAIIAEEFGFIGCICILFLFFIFIFRILMIARFAEFIGKSFEAYVSYGIAVIFSLQIIINIGVSTGLFPTKGLTLPFLSYGGSSLLVCSIFTGIILRIHKELSLFKKEYKSKKYGQNGGRDLIQSSFKNSTSRKFTVFKGA